MTKLKLAEILRQVLLTDMDMRSVDGTLHLRPEALNRVCGRTASRNIFARVMVHLLVPIAVVACQRVIRLVLVGVHFGIGTYVPHDMRH